MASEKFSPPWQSFVDCLSTVLLIMVFFSIVLVILVSVLSYSISKKEMEQTRSTESKQAVEDVIYENEGENLGEAVDIESLMTKGEARFIIYYEGLLSETTQDVMEEFQAWVKERDPANRKTLMIVQQVVIDNVSASGRRLAGFKRYYALSRFIKNSIGNHNVIKSFSVIKGDQQENRAIITFE